jgi:transposase
MVTMSQKEFQRVKVIENAAGGRLSVREASRLLQLSERQVQRLKRRYQPHSVGWVKHGNRGRSMPWAVSIPQKQLILTLARGKYLGFNDSHLTEGLSLQMEYCFQVPANRIGSYEFTTAHLKIIQGVITLTVFSTFSVIYLKESLKWNYLVGFAMMVGAVFVIFKKW